MSSYSYLQIWSNKKLAFKSTICQCCNQPIPIDDIRKDFLRDVRGKLKINDPQIKKGEIKNFNPLIALFFEDYNYEENEKRVNGSFYQIGYISMGNWVNLQHVSILADTFDWLTIFIELLSKHFPQQNFYYHCVDGFGEEFISWTQIYYEVVDN